MHPHVVIVGGGIIGCACAYYLSLAGARVRLLERGPLGSGTSKAGMSHVVTWEEPATHLALARASQRLYEELNESLPMPIEYCRTGSLAVVEDGQGLPGMAATLDQLGAWGLECCLLDATELREVEPRLAADLAGGAYFPGDGMVNPLLVTQALSMGARERGALIQTGVEVTAIHCSADGRVEAVDAGSERIPCGSVVIAAGAWSGTLAESAGIRLPIRPRKGTLLVTAPLPDDFLRCKVILSAGYMDSVHSGAGGTVVPGGTGVPDGISIAANIQQVKAGSLLLGSSREFSGYDLRVDPAVVKATVARCLRILPDLARASAIRMWAGLRPSTPDLLPVIGPVSTARGLYIAAGHEGIGITEAPITGKLISQLVTGEAPELDIRALSPDRFQE